MELKFRPSGVCAREIIINMDGETVENVQFIGGCNGNGKGIGLLCKGRNAHEIIALLRGNTCGMKRTSCPDQLAIALERYLKDYSQDK